MARNLMSRSSELPLPYVPIDPMIEESARFLAFVEAADLHGSPMALLHIIRLLLLVGRAPTLDGTIRKMSPRQLAHLCCWVGDADIFVAALKSSGWLIDGADGLAIEGWQRHGGKVLEIRIQTRERVARLRAGARDKGDVTRTNANVTRTNANVTRTPDCTVNVTRTNENVRVMYTTEGEGEGEGEEEKENDVDARATSERHPSDIRATSHRHGGDSIELVPMTGALTLPQVESLGRGLGWRRSSEVFVALRAAYAARAPVTRNEFDEALRLTVEQAQTPCWGFWLRKLEFLRSPQARAPPPLSREGQAIKRSIECSMDGMFDGVMDIPEKGATDARDT